MKKYHIARKAIILTLIFALLTALVLTACKAPDEKPVATDIPATEVPTEVPTEKPTPAPTEVPTEKPTKAPPASGTNVALRADVEVSSTTGQTHVQWGWDYEYINDGRYYDADPDDPSVGWTTAVGVNTDDPEQEEWIQFTLEQDTSINKIIVYPVGYPNATGGNFCPECFKIEVSADGKEYTVIAEVVDNTRAADKDTTPFTFEFDAITCRYVRFVATRLYRVPSPADGYLCQLAEIEIFAA